MRPRFRECASLGGAERISRAVRLTKSGAYGLVEEAVSGPRAGEVCIAMRWACIADDELRPGAATGSGRGIGRFGYGDVVAVGAGDSSIRVGDAVIVAPTSGCATVAAFACVGADDVWAVANDVPGPLALLAWPLTRAMSDARGVAGARHIAIIGHGLAGALIHLELRRAGVREIDVVEHSPTRATLAEALGAIVVPSLEDVDLSDYSAVFDTTLATSNLPPDCAPSVAAALERLTAEPSRYRCVLTTVVGMERAAERIAQEAKSPDSVALIVRMN